MAEQNFSNMFPWGNLARCVVNADGSVAYFLDENNSNLKADGTEVDWQEVEDNVQNVMVQIPKFYSAKKSVNGSMVFGVGKTPTTTDLLTLDDWRVDPAFFRDRLNLCDVQTGTATEVDYRYVGAFHGWVDGQGRLRSLPNKMPTADKTIGEFRDHAKNMGNGWSQFDFNLLTAIQMLYITEYGNPDSQTMIGRGYVDGNSSAINTGGTIDKGNNTFGETTGKVQMSFRGIEDFYGNVRNWIDGCFFDSGFNILINNKGFNDTGAGYSQVGQSGFSSDSGGNVRTIQEYSDAGFIIKTSDGNSDYDTGLYDYAYIGSVRLPYFGGDWSYGSSAGAFSLYSRSASYSGSSIGGRLVF